MSTQFEPLKYGTTHVVGSPNALARGLCASEHRSKQAAQRQAIEGAVVWPRELLEAVRGCICSGLVPIRQATRQVPSDFPWFYSVVAGRPGLIRNLAVLPPGKKARAPLIRQRVDLAP